MRIIGLNHVGLTVGNLEQAVRHYCDVLGLRLLAKTEDESPMIRTITGIPDARVKIADLQTSNGGLLELIEYVAPQKPQHQLSLLDVGTSHIGLQVDDIDAAYARLVAASVPVTSTPVNINAPGTIWHGARVLYSRDPDGRTVELIETGAGLTPG
jgi:catechol 2,3-dioxygenase-like lactoylglutathione lyase family enzyme